MSRWGLLDKTLEGRQRLFFPHHHVVPMGVADNIRYRSRIYRTTNQNDQKHLWRMCSEDFLFYMKTFIWIFQAKGEPKPIPFVPYDFQEELAVVLWSCLHENQRDVRIKKPRDVGASWEVMSLFEHAWKFRRNVHLLIGSRKEAEIDGVMTDPESNSPLGEWSRLLPKVDFIHMHQPSWMWPGSYRPRTEPFRTRLRIVNPEYGSLIVGESANPKFGRSGRYYGIGFDEHAHTEHGFDIIAACSATSDCHIWWSSPNGPDCGFGMLGRAPIVQVSLNWWMVPPHSEGLSVDPDTGNRSSPWYEERCAALGYDQKLIADELLADESRASGAYYGPDVFDIIDGKPNKVGSVMDPLHTGELDVEMIRGVPTVMRFCEQPNGRWFFWESFGRDGSPLRNTRYAIGVDVAMGSTDPSGRGASNSVIVVVNATSGSVVAEYATHGKPPYELAELAFAVGNWYSGEDELPALMVPERNGPGADFIRVLTEKYRYENMFMEKKANRMRYGWHKDGHGDSARLAFGLHTLYIVEGKLVERSRICSEEMKHYEADPTGRGAPRHRASVVSRDPSGARENHGDRVTARVCVCQGLKRLLVNPPEATREPPWGSLAHVEKLREDRELASSEL